jgi:hypothetical protein
MSNDEAPSPPEELTREPFPPPIAPEPYAACVIEFLDRESGSKRAMCYPITRLWLLPLAHPDNVAFAFKVDRLGDWERIEAPLPDWPGDTRGITK